MKYSFLGNCVVDLLDRIAAKRGSLTDSDAKIAQYIAKNYANLAYASATAIAQQTGVSPATAVRFFLKLGYGSFAEVTAEVRQSIEEQLSSPLNRLDTMAPSSSLADIVSRTAERESELLRAALGGNQVAKILGLAELLLQVSGTIFILGERKAHAPALYLFAQLNLCLDRVRLLASTNSLMGDQLLDIGPDDALLVFDLRRYIKLTVSVAAAFKSRGAQVYVIGDNETSRIATSANFGVYSSVEGTAPFDSYSGIMAINNALTNVVAAGRKKTVQHRMQVAEETFQQLEIFNPKTLDD